LNTQLTAQTIAAFGTWSSPITADLIATAATGLSTPWLEDGVAWWPRTVESS